MFASLKIRSGSNRVANASPPHSKKLLMRHINNRTGIRQIFLDNTKLSPFQLPSRPAEQPAHQPSTSRTSLMSRSLRRLNARLRTALRSVLWATRRSRVKGRERSIGGFDGVNSDESMQDKKSKKNEESCQQKTRKTKNTAGYQYYTCSSCSAPDGAIADCIEFIKRSQGS